MFLELGLIPLIIMHLNLFFTLLRFEGVDVGNWNAVFSSEYYVLVLLRADQRSLSELGCIIWLTKNLLSLSPSVEQILGVPSFFRYRTSISLLKCISCRFLWHCTVPRVLPNHFEIDLHLARLFEPVDIINCNSSA